MVCKGVSCVQLNHSSRLSFAANARRSVACEKFALLIEEIDMAGMFVQVVLLEKASHAMTARRRGGTAPRVISRLLSAQKLARMPI
jgi:hypothetical protein